MTKMNCIVHINSQGELPLPADLCQQYNLKPGTTLHLVDLEGILAIVPFEPQVPILAQKIEQLRIESGIPFEDLLQNLYTLRHFPQF
jgi:bifunctional DNA-binding transcriptional regulator/antitoxin component of YhaV-PrlF toxin-antitoxin module